MDNTQSTDLLFEISQPGRRCHRLPACDVPAAPLDELIPREHLADAPPPLPEVGEIDLVRHYTNLSTRNMSIDTNFYPLGSCTMKYNPKRHERLAALPGLRRPAPATRTTTRCQGMLELLYEMQEYPRRDRRAAAVSLQPAAGAQGELTALLVAAAYFRDRGETQRTQGARSPTAPTAPTPPAPPSPASRPSRSRATRTGSSISTTSRPSSTTTPPCS